MDTLFLSLFHPSRAAFIDSPPANLSQPIFFQWFCGCLPFPLSECSLYFICHSITLLILMPFFYCFLSSYFSHLFGYLCHLQLILVSSLFFHPPSLCLFPCTSSHILPSNLDLLFPAFISYATSPPGWCWIPILYSSSFSFAFIMPPLFLFSPLLSPSFFFFSPSHIKPFPFLSPVQTPCQKPQWLWVAEAVSFLLQWGLRQDDCQHHRCGLCLPKRILGLYWKAGHYAIDWQVDTHARIKVDFR